MRTLILLLFTVALAAQSVDRTKVPDTPPLAPYKLPPLAETTLPNGLLVVAVHDQRFPIVAARIGFRAGAKFDPKDQSGLAETAAALLKEGTKTRTSRQIAEEMAAIGGMLQTASSPDSLALNGTALSEHLASLLDVLADLAQNADFPDSELKLRKQNRTQELLAQRAEASTLADEKLQQVLFGSHPYSRMLPTAESIGRIDRAALLGFRMKYLVPNNAILVLTGDLPPQEELMKLVRARFEAWRKGASSAEPPAVFPPSKKSFVLVDRPGSVQADIRVGKLSVDRSSPEFFPLLVANGILGMGGSSRIFQHIREEKGYAYDAHSEASPRRHGGFVQAVTQVRNEVVQPALDDLFAEMKKMAAEPVTKDELTNIKNYLAGTFVLRLETQNGLAAQLAMVKLSGLPNDYLDKYVTRIRSVEPDQILGVSKKYINPDNAAVVVVGDAAQIAKPLEKFGTFTVEKTK